MAKIAEKPAVWFRIVCLLALTWNSLGAGQFLAQATMDDEIIAKLPEAAQAELAAMPLWYTLAFGVAVFAGIAGSFCLLVQKRMAVLLLFVSLLAVITQQIYTYGMSEAGQYVLQGKGAFMALAIPVVAVLLLGLARYANSKKWLV